MALALAALVVALAALALALALALFGLSLSRSCSLGCSLSMGPRHRFRLRVLSALWLRVWRRLRVFFKEHWRKAMMLREMRRILVIVVVRVANQSQANQSWRNQG